MTSAPAALEEIKTRIPPESRWAQYPKIFAGAGVVALVAAYAIAASSDPGRFSYSYLVAFMYGLSLALGALFFVIVQFLAKAGWSVVVRRIAENLMGTLPLFAVLFIPVALGLGYTHHHWWHAPSEVDPILAAKTPYLNPTFFFARAALYFVVWSALAIKFWRSSTAQDESGDHQITRNLQRLSAPALILFSLTSTFAAIDWMKSMDPHWYSTIFGVYYFSGAVVGVFAMLCALLIWLQRDGFITQVINLEHFHDLGKLLFGFIVFWSYIAFSQYFLIWYANIPEETIWFQHRAHGGWETVGQFLIVAHFAVPFFFLLPRSMKRNVRALLFASLWVLVVHYVDLYYVIMPVYSDTLQPSAADVLTLVGVVSLQLAYFCRLAAKAELIPMKDPRLVESVAFENI